ncbi:MAG: hypothetical protein M0Q44_16755 [Methylobacter sp.]|jgi:hypothetical protein|nr:hypothetical protein [Methylobacter sp.]
MPSETPSQQELLDRIMYGSSGVKATEAAIQSALKTFTDATANQVSVLIQNNMLYPEMREEMLQLEKRVMEMTLEAIDSIQSRVPEPPKSGSKNNP